MFGFDVVNCRLDVIVESLRNLAQGGKDDSDRHETRKRLSGIGGAA